MESTGCVRGGDCASCRVEPPETGPVRGNYGWRRRTLHTMRPRAILLILLAVSLAATLGLLTRAFVRGVDRGGMRPAAPDTPIISSAPDTTGATAPSASGNVGSQQAPTPAPDAPGAEPVVPINLPTPAPGLDRALAADFRKALEGQGFRIAALTIVDTRATAGVRRAEIIYRTTTGRTIEALRSEMVRLVGPGANPKLALDQIVVRATTPAGAAIVTATITVADLDRWLKTEVADAEFYRRWTVQPGR